MPTMKAPLLLCAAAAIAIGATVTAADVRLGLVSYWPLDALTADEFYTADVVSAYDLNVVGLTSASVVPGKRGNALLFDGTTSVAYRTSFDPEERLPISKGRYYTVMFWVKGAGKQSDRRVFSESNCELADNDPPREHRDAQRRNRRHDRSLFPEQYRGRAVEPHPLDGDRL